ncbi:hypothetical protein DV736_g4286, partial [Chaetothyriales sp. CBS 134916]
MANFEDRNSDFVEDTTKAELSGQLNLGQETRTKITHSEFLGCGIIGSVKGVHYGSWKDQSACLILMQFNFRSSSGFLRLKRAELYISFTKDMSKAPDSNDPTLCVFSPRKIYGKPHTEERRWTFEIGFQTSVSAGPASAGLSAATTRESAYTRDHRLKISGEPWAERRMAEMHQVIWSVEEAGKTAYGIPDVLNIGIVVAYNGPFQAKVEVKATTGANVPICTPPWSKDDPLLFDTITTKGSAPSTLEFNELGDAEWATLVPYLDEWQNCVQGP